MNSPVAKDNNSSRIVINWAADMVLHLWLSVVSCQSVFAWTVMGWGEINWECQKSFCDFLYHRR